LRRQPSNRPTTRNKPPSSPELTRRASPSLPARDCVVGIENSNWGDAPWESFGIALGPRRGEQHTQHTPRTRPTDPLPRPPHSCADRPAIIHDYSRPDPPAATSLEHEQPDGATAKQTPRRYVAAPPAVASAAEQPGITTPIAVAADDDTDDEEKAEGCRY
jgi:hypothetical protein